MSGRGRKPLTEEVKRLKGTLQKSRRNKERPKPDKVLVPACPLPLKGDAAEEWDRVVGELVGLGIMTALDTMMLAIYCMEVAEYLDAKRTLDAIGRTIVISDKDGNARDLRNHPAVVRANAAFRNLRSMGSEFGLTTASRESLKIKPKPMRN